MQTIQRVQAGLNPNLELEGVLMTMVDTRNALSGQVIAEVKKHRVVVNTNLSHNLKPMCINAARAVKVILKFNLVPP